MSSESPNKAITEATNQTPDDDAKQNDDQLPVAAPVAQENRSGIFKLDVDCCEEIFEWLSIKDLYSFGQTCKRMNRIAGMYFRQNYPMAEITNRPNGIHHNSTRLHGFSEYVENVTISSAFENSELEYIETNFKSLKKITFWSSSLSISNIILLIGDVPAKVESLLIYGNCPDENFFDLCPNLTQLTVNWRNTDWLFKLNKCPKLEHINLDKIDGWVVNVEAFFNQIPNIRTIKVSTQFLSANKDQLLSSNVKLDNLIINMWCNEKDTSICAILNKLHDCGFYKRLHFHFTYFAPLNQQWIDRMASLRALETLGISEVDEGVVWPVMHVKKMYIFDLYQLDLTTLPSKLPNLQRLRLRDKSIGAIMPFVRCSKHLSSIIMGHSNFSPPNDDILDLSTLNKKRAKLDGAYKVTIYVPEGVFLETKEKNRTSRSLVQIKRKESFKMNVWNYWYLD
ncbi:uncharacterized protein LOC129566853 isoform X1 [Sitodiplosis mosellana]|uniref:uncharacterized protein LOC129566853 isoform X1 n=1 Tax=Sitodiplosis mosellana TaxID=263140 RepID=UPI0024445C09|nr:uncharacterized protein LOC129566853 isoform X1 [Sitodiplosis mosellana]